MLHGSAPPKEEAQKGERRLQRTWRQARSWLRQGRRPHIFWVVGVAAGSLLVFLGPRSLIAFWLFLAAAFISYTLPTGRRFKTVLFAIVLLVIMPILGLRNIFYLELAFQISVFTALALGLNIVVGFAGLLDLGYVGC